VFSSLLAKKSIFNMTKFMVNKDYGRK